MGVVKNLLRRKSFFKADKNRKHHDGLETSDSTVTTETSSSLDTQEGSESSCTAEAAAGPAAPQFSFSDPCLYPSVAATLLARPRRRTLTEHARRVGVGACGTLICAVGLVMLPAPGPGLPIIAGGMMVIGTEFPVAQRVLDNGLGALATAIEGKEGRRGADVGTAPGLSTGVPAPRSKKTKRNKMGRMASSVRKKTRAAGRVVLLPGLRKYLDKPVSRVCPFAGRTKPIG